MVGGSFRKEGKVDIADVQDFLGHYLNSSSLENDYLSLDFSDFLDLPLFFDDFGAVAESVEESADDAIGYRGREDPRSSLYKLTPGPVATETSTTDGAQVEAKPEGEYEFEQPRRKRQRSDALVGSDFSLAPAMSGRGGGDKKNITVKLPKGYISAFNFFAVANRKDLLKQQKYKQVIQQH
jgi:hypothetical protein